MTPSSNQWLFSLTVFLQGNTGCSFSRDIQEAVPKQVVKCQFSINPTWKPNSFQYSLDSSTPVFQSYIMGKSFNTVHFPIWQVNTDIIKSSKWIEPYLSNLTNQNPSYLLNSWKLFESQLFTLFGDPNEVRKAEAELDSLRIKEGRNVSLYIADFRSLVSRIGDWGERALIHHFRKGFPSRILDQLASHPSRIDSLQDLMDITLELDTRYHERQNEKSHHQEKNPEASKSDYSHPQSSSSSSQKKKKKPHSSLLNKYFKLINSEKERRIKEGLCTYCGGKHSLDSCFKRPQNKRTQLEGKIPSQGKA
ncbi:hypothetical protein O181_012745 [Austropuccinia psidii MF-1]|uniref:Retrotransposon gag domain-containing protein n=1 Tax=Austropuccinia psidii MF-1 TaxID=1389203 RepID=A0A9Q3BXP0_9BASI|nr:hypothetical protein [Austropuccinia psidii MF-1]